MPRNSSGFRPLFQGQVIEGNPVTLVDRDGQSCQAIGESGNAIAHLVASMDGTRSIPDLALQLPSLPRGDCEAIVDEMDALGLLDDASVPKALNGLEFLMELEELTDRLSTSSIDRNPFWQACLNARQPGDVPLSVVHGMVIENWHFLVRESYFDAPVLSFVPNRAVRLAMNEFFAEEHGHDNILLRSLETLGLTSQDMHDSIPLPETLGLCNALAYWSLNDPLFFFTTLGLLEGQGVKTDSFIDACERMGVDPQFVEPLRLHSEINIGASHGSLTRLIYASIGAVDQKARARLRAQTHLFVELYDAFYQGVWRHYSAAPTLLRRVSEL